MAEDLKYLWKHLKKLKPFQIYPKKVEYNVKNDNMSNNKITPLTLYVYHNIESQKWGFVLTLQYVYETIIPLVMQLNCAHPILQIKLLRRLFYEMFCSRY